MNIWRRSTSERLSNADRELLIKKNRFHTSIIKAKWIVLVDIIEVVCCLITKSSQRTFRTPKAVKKIKMIRK